MGLFGDLWRQVKWQQQMELAAVEACEIDRTIDPRLLKAHVRQAVRTAKMMGCFRFPIPRQNIRDGAYTYFLSAVEMNYNACVKSGDEYGSKVLLRCYRALLQAGTHDILGLSQPLVQKALDTQASLLFKGL